ncbi:MAG: MFS transporter [Candidatus Latescibacteria bacterium]|jgi:MFS transporter, UMF1 family|nr:MFS transporter [Candidatus Latescibacterota bacterium]
MTTERKQIASWCLYDFANSGYSAVIVTAIFGPYFTSHIVGNETGLGDVWWGRVSSVSMLFVALSSPLLGGIADAGGLRKRLWITYTWLAILMVVGFTVLEPGMVVTGFVLATLANIGMEGAMVFYNAYLPQIAITPMQGRISGWGYATGYAGSIVALLAAYSFTDPFEANPIWILVATQFALFSIPAFLWLPETTSKTASLGSAAKQGFESAWTLLGRLWKRPTARRFLLAYLFYEDGVTTVLVFSSIFAATTLGMETGQLVMLFLVVQFSALFGAIVMAKPTDIKGPKFVVVCSLILWCCVVTAAYFVETQTQYWIVGIVAGLGLGSVQAASRALYSRFIPEGEENQYFGLYAMVGKSAAIGGPILFGEVSRAMGSQRPAILSVIVLFAIGLILLHGVRLDKSTAELRAP